MVLVPSWDHVIWATLGNTGHHYNVAFHPMTPRVSHSPASLTNTGPCRDIRSYYLHHIAGTNASKPAMYLLGHSVPRPLTPLTTRSRTAVRLSGALLMSRQRNQANAESPKTLNSTLACSVHLGIAVSDRHLHHTLWLSPMVRRAPQPGLTKNFNHQSRH